MEVASGSDSDLGTVSLTLVLISACAITRSSLASCSGPSPTFSAADVLSVRVTNSTAYGPNLTCKSAPTPVTVTLVRSPIIALGSTGKIKLGS